VQPGPAELDSIAAAQALVPFTLLVPDLSTTTAPLELTDVLWWPEDEKGLQAVDLEYRSSAASLTLTEIQLPSRMTAPNMPYQALRVRGQVAFLISSEEADNMTLLWQEDQRAIFLSAEGFSVEGLVEIAEGLKPAQ
jgi:squalene cyclase